MNNEEKFEKNKPASGNVNDNTGHIGNNGKHNGNGGGHGRPRTPGTSHPLVTKWNGN